MPLVNCTDCERGISCPDWDQDNYCSAGVEFGRKGLMGRGWCQKHKIRLSLGRHFEEYCSQCNAEEKQRSYTEMACKRTGKDEMQYVVRESEDGITLRCGGCGKHHSHEIGEFAHLYQGSTSLPSPEVKTQ